MADEREAALEGKSEHREIVSKEIRNRKNKADEGDRTQCPRIPTNSKWHGSPPADQLEHDRHQAKISILFPTRFSVSSA